MNALTRQCVHTGSEVVLMHRIGISMCLRPPATWGTGDGSFRRSLLVEVGVGARSFADKTLCRVRRARRGRAAARGRVALGRAVPKRGILYTYSNTH